MDEDKFRLQYLLTPQEHALVGSGVPKYSERWYTPLAVQEGENIEEISRERMKNGTARFLYIFWTRDGKSLEFHERDYDGCIPAELAPLNLETGETLHDPRPVDKSLEWNPKYKERFKLRVETPPQ